MFNQKQKLQEMKEATFKLREAKEEEIIALFFILLFILWNILVWEHIPKKKEWFSLSAFFLKLFSALERSKFLTCKWLIFSCSTKRKTEKILINFKSF